MSVRVFKSQNNHTFADDIFMKIFLFVTSTPGYVIPMI